MNADQQAKVFEARAVLHALGFPASQSNDRYAANTRESIRRLTLRHFVDAGLARYNPDGPNRAINSPASC